jgi:phage gp36-like protein
MAYATAAELSSRLRRAYAALYGDDETGVVDESLMTADLDAASAEIDGAIAARYAVPVTADGALALLKAWTLTLAEELAYSRSGGADLPEKVKAMTKNVREQLSRIADGKFRLPADPAESTGGAGSAVLIKRDRPVMTRKKLQGF